MLGQPVREYVDVIQQLHRYERNTTASVEFGSWIDTNVALQAHVSASKPRSCMREATSKHNQVFPI